MPTRSASSWGRSYSSAWSPGTSATHRFRLQRVFEWTPDVRKVLLLMLPVTISLGLINFNLVINSLFATLVSERAPAAIDKAFRIYMLPQGMFSVAVATVIFPTLSRYAARLAYDDLRRTMANGMRQIILLLVPAAAAILVLSEPMIRLVYERGEFDASQTELVATALFWFSFSLPFNGLFLLITRTFFSLQRPWIPTVIAALNLAITAIGRVALYKPFGVGGIVAATAIATSDSVLAQGLILRRELNGLEIGSLIDGTLRIAVGSADPRRGHLRVWSALESALGDDRSPRSSPSAAAWLSVGSPTWARCSLCGCPRLVSCSASSAGGPRYPIWGRFRGADEPDVRQLLPIEAAKRRWAGSQPLDAVGRSETIGQWLDSRRPASQRSRCWSWGDAGSGSQPRHGGAPGGRRGAAAGPRGRGRGDAHRVQARLWIPDPRGGHDVR